MPRLDLMRRRLRPVLQMEKKLHHSAHHRVRGWNVRDAAPLKGNNMLKTQELLFVVCIAYTKLDNALRAGVGPRLPSPYVHVCSLSLSIYIYIYTYTHTYTRKSERKVQVLSPSLYLYVSLSLSLSRYVYMYFFLHIVFMESYCIYLNLFRYILYTHICVYIYSTHTPVESIIPLKCETL
jgi:hypothetical protein